MYFFFVFQIFECVRVSIIINFMNLFRQMPVNTRRQTAGLSPLIKVSKKNRKKTVPEPIPASEPERSNGKTMYKDKYMISLTERTCSCGSFMKHAVCGHILAYTYRHTKLDKECWFGEQYSNLPTEFARNAKRGAPKKQTGRPKNSEKALSKY